MSARLESLLTPEQRAACEANDTLLACCTHRCYEAQGDTYGYPTSRRHPRTLAEAFPAERAVASEPHIPPPLLTRIGLFFRRRFAL